MTRTIREFDARITFTYEVSFTVAVECWLSKRSIIHGPRRRCDEVVSLYWANWPVAFVNNSKSNLESTQSTP